MADCSDWLLYGAYGYTGRRIAEAAVRRGMRPVLAGRDRKRLELLAARLECPWRVFSLDAPDAIAAQVRGLSAVLHCAGPFSTTASPMIEACLSARVNYLDITGEIEVIEAAARTHARAVAAGISLLPAVGFDVVPSDCLSAMLVRRLPGATHLELAFEMFGRPSRGTVRTMLEALPRGGRVRQDGQIVAVPLAWKIKEIPFAHGRRWATTVPWGDVASAYHSTGIPNVAVYVSVPRWQVYGLRWLRPLLAVLGTRWGRRAADSLIRPWFGGPTVEQEQTTRGAFWGRVRDQAGKEASATLETPSGYALTVSTALAALEKVLARQTLPGFSTPSRAFGPNFILAIEGTRLRWQEDIARV